MCVYFIVIGISVAQRAGSEEAERGAGNPLTSRATKSVNLAELCFFSAPQAAAGKQRKGGPRLRQLVGHVACNKWHDSMNIHLPIRHARPIIIITLAPIPIIILIWFQFGQKRRKAKGVYSVVIANVIDFQGSEPERALRWSPN